MVVTPIVCPKDLYHFTHGLFARSDSQIIFTLCGKYSISDYLCKCSEDADSVGRGEVVEEFFMVKLDDVDQFGPAYLQTIELGSCARCAGDCSGISCNRKFINR